MGKQLFLSQASAFSVFTATLHLDHFFLLLLLLPLLPYSIHASAEFNPAVCAAVSNEVTFYYYPPVVAVVNPPVASCSTCYPNAFYFASAPFATPFNGKGTYHIRRFFRKKQGFAFVLTCTNWCVCDAAGNCASNLDTAYVALYPYCLSPGNCQMYAYFITKNVLGSQVLLTPSNTIVNVPFCSMVGPPCTQPPVTSQMAYTSASCGGCNFSVTCTTLSTASASEEPPTPAASCFSADTTFHHRRDGVQRMDHLRLDDWVLAAEAAPAIESSLASSSLIDGQRQGRLVWSRVEAWLHRVPNVEATFYLFRLANGQAVKLTAKHFIYRALAGEAGCSAGEGILGWEAQEALLSPTLHSNFSHIFPSSSAVPTTNQSYSIHLYYDDADHHFLHEVVVASSSQRQPFYQLLSASAVLKASGGPVFADEVRVGDCLFSLMTTEELHGGGGELGFVASRVVSVELVRGVGIYAPLTTAGNIIVDGVLASCHTLINQPALHHDVVKASRQWWPIDLAMGMAAFGEKGEAAVIELSGLIKNLLEIAEIILP